MRRGAIILCGGRSSRMGRDKATLPFGPEQMLQSVARRINAVVELERIAVVAAPGQVLPELPRRIVIARDDRPDRGPLEGLAAGLRALVDRADVVYATGCDVPLLAPELVERMFELLGDHDVAVPRDAERCYPLAAVYRVDVLAQVQGLLDAGRLSLRSLFAQVSTREIPVEQLRAVDPTLATLENVNSPAEYEAALRAAGLARGAEGQTPR